MLSVTHNGRHVFSSIVDDFNIRQLTSAPPMRMLQSQNKKGPPLQTGYGVVSCSMYVHSEGPDMPLLLWRISSNFMPN